jgi:hypothetical protein
MIVDVHCHYAFTHRPAAPGERFSFEPADEDGRPALDSCLTPRFYRGPARPVLQHMLGFDWRLQPGPELDAALERWYVDQLCADGPCERSVLLAFDRYHDDFGEAPPFPESRGEFGSDMYASNSMVWVACRRHPQRWLFGASVHPYRPNALACVDEVFAGGACLLKWIPLHQNIDCRDPRTLGVLRRCAELGLPLLVHYGQEFTLATQHPEYQSIAPLLEVLADLRREGCMPPVIVAHVATPAVPLGPRESFNLLVEALLGEFADAPLYADISALTAWSKLGWLRKVARMQELHGKLVFGSDFPVPIGLLPLRLQLGRSYRRIAAEPSLPQRAVAIYRHCGFNEIVFHRAAELLANVDGVAGTAR